jgi:hypothetical protein
MRDHILLIRWTDSPASTVLEYLTAVEAEEIAHEYRKRPTCDRAEVFRV